MKTKLNFIFAVDKVEKQNTINENLLNYVTQPTCEVRLATFSIIVGVLFKNNYLS